MRQWRHWIPWMLMMGYSVWGFAPFLAPVFMEIGWLTAVEGFTSFILVSATNCLNAPFFLFGEKAMYSLAETQAVWECTTDPLVLRQFLGTPHGMESGLVRSDGGFLCQRLVLYALALGGA